MKLEFFPDGQGEVHHMHLVAENDDEQKWLMALNGELLVYKSPEEPDRVVLLHKVTAFAHGQANGLTVQGFKDS